MLRFLAGAGSALLLIAAGFFIWTGLAQDEEALVPEPRADAGPVPLTRDPPARPPAADARSREQRRFDRADRDNDGRITLAELLYPRQRPFQRLDTNRDGRLSFEEWAVRTRTKFGEADRDRNSALSREEYAATAPRPRPASREKGCAC